MVQNRRARGRGARAARRNRRHRSFPDRAISAAPAPGARFGRCAALRRRAAAFAAGVAEAVLRAASCRARSRASAPTAQVGALPIELAARGHHVVSISPRFDQYPGAWDTGVSVRVLGEDVRFFHEHKKGVHRVFVDHPLFLAKGAGRPRRERGDTGEKALPRAPPASRSAALHHRAVSDAPRLQCGARRGPSCMAVRSADKR